MDADALREELARQDAECAAVLRRVDAVAAACTTLADADAAARAFLAGFSAEASRRAGELAHGRDELAAARTDVERASAALAEAGRDATRTAVARRRLDHALATQQVAEQHEARLQERVAELGAAHAATLRERALLLGRARELTRELRALGRVSARATFDVAEADGLASWTTSVRAALLVTRSGLAAEREALLRQRAELDALGDGH
jgi:chromosome segregation ATPase